MTLDQRVDSELKDCHRLANNVGKQTFLHFEARGAPRGKGIGTMRAVRRRRAGSQLHAQTLHALVLHAIPNMAADVIEPSCKAHPEMRNCLHE